jgi:hypothetical protein
MRQVLTPGARSYAPRMRDIDTIDSELIYRIPGNLIGSG